MKIVYIVSLRCVHIKIVRTEKLMGNVYTDSHCKRIRDMIYGYATVVRFVFHINDSYKIYILYKIKNSAYIYCTMKLFIREKNNT